MTSYDFAQRYIGLKEIAGPKADATIAAMFAKAGHPEIKSDEVSWCAAFVGACLVDVGMKGTGSLAARSYLKWGRPVDLAEAQPGDVVVFWRVKPDGWQGHVGFFAGQTAKTIKVLGGNQSDSVSYGFYPKDRLLGVRRAGASGRPVVPAPPAPAHPDPVEQPPSGGFFAALAAMIARLFGRK